MEYNNFKESYNQFCQNWQRRGSEDHAEFLHSKIGFIPGNAWDDISEDALATLERFPRLKDFFVLWYKWRQANSSELISDAPDETDCRWCQGVGFLEYLFDYSVLGTRRKAYGYQGIAPCAYCENWKRSISPKRWKETRKYTVEAIEDNGWQWVRPPDKCSKDEALVAMAQMFDKLDAKPRDAFRRDADHKLRLDHYEEDSVPF